ncbi:Fungal transcriptional regulatory protein [Cordyceps militaris CM01]|uniref:Fungal transcriptional regulatory protein n=1 Tax=Cordyceps militaris (strain CM01) TaxID=983644 RepID=G3JIF3_CORMM|nr:Fungal transcriptional regulatory protein [Cordyceps militaris CM01]EGX91054.1 Fungal transcriptional regulatory protein [Cordyceps militaris CM01]
MESNSSRAARSRLSCSECQRRKQKCNREWPCNHCLKRKVADKCHFALPTANAPAEAPTASDSRKRQASSDETDTDIIPTVADFQPGSLGYHTADLLAGLGLEDKKDAPDDNQYWTDVASCSALGRAFKEFPKRHWVDSLLRIFFNNINNQFYILYPAAFFDEYRNWWTRVQENRPVALQFTALLFTVCACSIQHADESLKAVIERDMGDSTEILSEKYHNIARELGSVVPPGSSHLHSCQSMLHSSYWYISQAKYPEAWHALSAAARECQILVREKDQAFHQLPSFEREMRRRLWCVIQILDWQTSAGLARPTIVNWSAVEVVLPALTMEAFSPSPMLHMKIQSQLISQLAVTYPNTINLEPSEIRQYQATVEAWAKAFPRVYAFGNPDTSKDATNPWIIFNRFYLYTMAYFLLLASIRPVMLKGYTSALSEEEQGLCADGIKYCAKNIRVAVLWADHVDRHGGGYHFMISSVFDTVVLLCTCIMKDVENTMKKEDEVYEELDNAVSLFARLAHTSSTAKFAFDTASQLVPRLQRPDTVRRTQKRQKTDATEVSPAPVTEATGLVSALSPGLALETGSETSPEQLSRGFLTPASMSDGWQGSTDDVRQTPSVGDPQASFGAIDESLSPWPMDNHDETASVEPIAAYGEDFRFLLEEQATDDLADQAGHLDDFAALWDWEALGLGTYPLEKPANFGD